MKIEKNKTKYMLLLVILFFISIKINVLAIENLSYASTNNYLVAISKSNSTKLTANKNDEKIHQTNKIVKIWIGSDGILNATAEIHDNKEEVKIFIYNLLGKELNKIYDGLPTEKDNEGYYKFTSSTPINLPFNIYILVMQGTSYKIADKFIISKQ